MNMSRQINVNVPKMVFETFKPMLKSGETKDAMYTGLLNWGFHTASELPKDQKPALFPVPPKAKTEERNVIVPEEILAGIQKLLPDMSTGDACVHLILVGAADYLNTLMTDKPEETTTEQTTEQTTELPVVDPAAEKKGV